MKIQFVSDLHLELTENSRFIKHCPISPTGDYLILAGDITYIEKKNDKFFKWCSKNFKKTFWLPGNHEFYGKTDLQEYQGFVNEEIHDNVFIVNNTSIQLEKNVRMVFSTLWSEINPSEFLSVQNGITDYKRISFNGKPLQIVDINTISQNQTEFLKKEILNKKDKEKLIVVSHHVPSYSFMNPKYLNSSVNSAFAQERTSYDYNLSNVNYWIYGNSHYNVNDHIKIEDTVFRTNQLGYVHRGEHFTFSPCKFIEL